MLEQVNDLTVADTFTQASAQIAKRRFREIEEQNFCGTDVLFAYLMLGEWLAGIAIAIIWSPKTWEGVTSIIHLHVWLAIWLGLAIIAMPILLVVRCPGQWYTRHTIAVAQALMSSLLIHLCGGRIEMHFLIFGSLAFFAFYRDWKTLVTFSLVVAVDHLVRGIYFPMSVFGVNYIDVGRWFEHVAWICFADLFLIRSCIVARKEMRGIVERQAALEKSHEAIEQQVLQRTAEAKASERRYKTLCSSAPLTIFETDEFGNWTFVGERWVRLTRRNTKAALGMNWLNVIESSEIERVEASYRRALESESDWSEEFRIMLPNQSVRWVRASATRCLRIGQNEARMIGTVEDITEHRQVEESARQIMILHERDDFMATLSHDLKNPIIGANRLLELFSNGLLGPLLPEQKKLLIQLRESNDRLLRLIQNLIGIYRYDKDTGSLQKDPVNLVTLTDLCIIDIAQLAKHKGVSIACQVECDALTVMADAGSLSRVLSNLLDNALKFTPQGGKLSVSIEQSAEGPTVHIWNTGSFMSEDARQKLFRRFWQGQNGKRYEPGTGLGLYICRQIVEAHSGKIFCWSDEELGTVFSFTLPSGNATLEMAPLAHLITGNDQAEAA